MSYGMQCKLVCMIPDLPITTIIAMLICNLASLAIFKCQIKEHILWQISFLIFLSSTMHVHANPHLQF